MYSQIHPDPQHRYPYPNGPPPQIPFVSNSAPQTQHHTSIQPYVSPPVQYPLSQPQYFPQQQYLGSSQQWAPPQQQQQQQSVLQVQYPATPTQYPVPPPQLYPSQAQNPQQQQCNVPPQQHNAPPQQQPLPQLNHDPHPPHWYSSQPQSFAPQQQYYQPQQFAPQQQYYQPHQSALQQQYYQPQQAAPQQAAPQQAAPQQQYYQPHQSVPQQQHHQPQQFAPQQQYHQPQQSYYPSQQQRGPPPQTTNLAQPQIHQHHPRGGPGYIPPQSTPPYGVNQQQPSQPKPLHQPNFGYQSQRNQSNPSPQPSLSQSARQAPVSSIRGGRQQTRPQLQGPPVPPKSSTPSLINGRLRGSSRQHAGSSRPQRPESGSGQARTLPRRLQRQQSNLRGRGIQKRCTDLVLWRKSD